MVINSNDVKTKKFEKGNGDNMKNLKEIKVNANEIMKRINQVEAIEEARIIQASIVKTLEAFYKVTL